MLVPLTLRRFRAAWDVAAVRVPRSGLELLLDDLLNHLLGHLHAFRRHAHHLQRGSRIGDQTHRMLADAALATAFG